MKILKHIVLLMITTASLLACKSSKKATATTLPPGVNSSLTETYWRLTELMGEPIVYKDGAKKEMHLILKKEDSLVYGHGGCNSFRGTYSLQEAGYRLSFSKLAGTLMACVDMQKETAFMEALQKVDNYAIQGKVLSLNKARMAPLAKFEAVYLK